MNTTRRLLQFLLIYLAATGALWIIKYSAGLSDYLIPSPMEVISIALESWQRYGMAVLNTAGVAAAGHIFAVILALAVALAARTGSFMASLTRTAAFNLQAYPIVAVAPIIFLFLGDGIASRLLIASMICYFPLLLSFLGIFSQPVKAVEHFFDVTGRSTWKLQVAVRSFENIDKLITVTVGSGTLAMVGAIVAEFLAATHGIGYVIRKALYQSSLAKILVCLFLIGLSSSLYLSAVEAAGMWIKKRLAGS